MKTQCPYCRTVHEVDYEYYKQIIECPYCAQDMFVEYRLNLPLSIGYKVIGYLWLVLSVLGAFGAVFVFADINPKIGTYFGIYIGIPILLSGICIGGLFLCLGDIIDAINANTIHQGRLKKKNNIPPKPS